MLGRRGVFPVLKVRVIRNNSQNRDTYVPDKRESRTVPEARSSALRARKAGIPSRYGLAPFWSVGHNRSLQEGDAQGLSLCPHAALSRQGTTLSGLVLTLTTEGRFSYSSSVYWHTNIVSSSDWLSMLEHICSEIN